MVQLKQKTAKNKKGDTTRKKSASKEIKRNEITQQMGRIPEICSFAIYLNHERQILVDYASGVIDQELMTFPYFACVYERVREYRLKRGHSMSGLTKM